MPNRKRRKTKGNKSFTISVNGEGHRFRFREGDFNTVIQVKAYLRLKKIHFRLIKHLEGPGEFEPITKEYNCNTIFFSAYLPANRRVTAYWDYENKLLYF